MIRPSMFANLMLIKVRLLLSHRDWETRAIILSDDYISNGGFPG